MAVVNQPVSQVGRAGLTVLPSPGSAAWAAASGSSRAHSATDARKPMLVISGMVTSSGRFGSPLDWRPAVAAQATIVTGDVGAPPAHPPYAHPTPARPPAPSPPPPATRSARTARA